MAKYLEPDYVAQSNIVPTLTPDEIAAAAQSEAIRARMGSSYAATISKVIPAAVQAGPMADNPNFASDVAAQVTAAKPADLSKINSGMTQAQIDLENARQTGMFYGASNKGYTAAPTSITKPDTNVPAVTPVVTPKTATPTANPAFDAILAVLSSYDMAGVASKMAEIRALYPDISSADLMTLLKYDKRFNAPYLDRFAGNAALMAKGFAPLDEKTYLANEQAYAKVFNAYGLKQFTNRQSYAKLIGGSVSPDEANTRVSMAFDRVLNDKPTLAAFNKFYSSIKISDIAATLLDPEQQLPALQRQVTAAEIGGQALQQGLQTSLLESSVTAAGYSNVQEATLGAENLANMGVTKSQATAGYSKIGEVLPTAEKLSSIYGSTLDQYGQLQAEQEQFQGLASAARKRKQLTEAEIGTFSGSSGTSKGSFSTGYLNKTNSAGQF